MAAPKFKSQAGLNSYFEGLSKGIFIYLCIYVLYIMHLSGARHTDALSAVNALNSLEIEHHYISSTF
jgi:hypothetical protein